MHVGTLKPNIDHDKPLEVLWPGKGFSLSCIVNNERQAIEATPTSKREAFEMAAQLWPDSDQWMDGDSPTENAEKYDFDAARTLGARGGKIGGSRASREDKQRAGAKGGRAGKGKKKPRRKS